MSNVVMTVKAIPSPLRERNRQRTRDRIVKAAAALFQHDGYDRTTMDDIAAHAEVSRATLFNYFRTKDSLLLPFIEDAFERGIQPGLSAYLKDQPDVFDAMRYLFLSVHQYMITMPGINQALMREFMRPEHWTHATNSGNYGFLKTLLELVRYGQLSGTIRTDTPPEKQVSYIGALFGSVFLNTVLDNETNGYPSEIDSLLQFIRSGLLPD